MNKPCNIPRDVIRILGGLSAIGLLGIIALAATGLDVPEGLLTLVAGSTAALGSMLSNTRVSGHDQGDSQNVTVVNPTTDPVNTTSQDVG